MVRRMWMHGTRTTLLCFILHHAWGGAKQYHLAAVQVFSLRMRYYRGTMTQAMIGRKDCVCEPPHRLQIVVNPFLLCDYGDERHVFLSVGVCRRLCLSAFRRSALSLVQLQG